MEIKWQDIIGYEGIYQVSSCGDIRVLTRIRKTRHGYVNYKGRVLKPSVGKIGYPKINLYKDGKYRTFNVHALVAKAFVEGYFERAEVNHIDGDKCNNNFWNLEWVTHLQNQQHASKNGLMLSGVNHPNHSSKRTK